MVNFGFKLIGKGQLLLNRIVIVFVSFTQGCSKVLILKILVAVCIYLTQIELKLNNTTLFFDATLNLVRLVCQDVNSVVQLLVLLI